MRMPLQICLFALALMACTSFAGENPLKEFGLEELRESGPELSAKDQLGKTAQLKDHRGHFVLLHLWATWCVPCRQELPKMTKFVASLGPGVVDFMVVSIDSAEERPQVQSIGKSLNLDPAALIVERDRDSERYFAWGIPMTYVIDEAGQILARGRGSVDWSKVSGERFKTYLEAHHVKTKM